MFIRARPDIRRIHSFSILFRAAGTNVSTIRELFQISGHVASVTLRIFKTYRVSQIKDPSFSKLKKMPNLPSDNREGKILENIDIKYFSYRASFMGNPVDREMWIRSNCI